MRLEVIRHGPPVGLDEGREELQPFGGRRVRGESNDALLLGEERLEDAAVRLEEREDHVRLVARRQHLPCRDAVLLQLRERLGDVLAGVAPTGVEGQGEMWTVGQDALREVGERVAGSHLDKDPRALLVQRFDRIDPAHRLHELAREQVAHLRLARVWSRRDRTHDGEPRWGRECRVVEHGAPESSGWSHQRRVEPARGAQARRLDAPERGALLRGLDGFGLA